MKSKMAGDPGSRRFASEQKSTSPLISRMTLLSAILALAVAVFSRLGAGEEVSDLQRLLRPRLSHNASIIPTGSLEFENLTARWSQYDAPSLNVVVSVATAEDVRQTVCRSCGL